VNLTGSELLGRERARLKGRRFASFVALSSRNAFHKFFRRLLENEGREEMELTIAHGEKPPWAVLLSGIGRPDNEGNVSLCQIAMMDITAAKTAETWRRKLLELTQDAVVSIDRRAQIMHFNPAAEKIFGYSAEEVVGKKVNILMAEPYASKHDSYIARYERTGETRAIGKICEVAACRKNGELFPVELSVADIRESHEARYTAVIRDISDKTQLRAQAVEAARLAAISETTAVVVHEIANPLNGMAMSLQLLKRELNKDSTGR
jgi:PAS domain S-box-containing protein